MFINERGQPFGRTGIARMIERTGEAAKLPFPVHWHRRPFFDGWSVANPIQPQRELIGQAVEKYARKNPSRTPKLAG